MRERASWRWCFEPFHYATCTKTAQPLADLMLAIQEPQPFWAAHERMMAEPHMSLEVAGRVLTDLGLDVAELSRQSEPAALRVQADVDRGVRDGVHSTPSFFFNGAPHDGHYDLDTLRAQLAQAPERLG